ncbi:transporting ATPase [Halieaceae bacterium IMCC14734]|uniref:Transporting ATPase n=1 Tax=Candidatus Litorirhabdus singularis TaxID=2518993 RepID=A0ABT3TGM5_9GAMM|nr:elongation factor P hydroxylase [Candidatus Litorirhabdus singularis]MCX2981461.1 transporting ATPase [Candidatus Litorirhabdus singularis]
MSAALRLEQVFADCFCDSHNTVLRGGADEPLYQPARRTQQQHQIFYRDDYFASALHEVAHWCIAGAKRRQLPDYGYWYQPDGRSGRQQQEFEAVEALPQALEWHFSLACAQDFHISADNLTGETIDADSFERQVIKQAQRLCEEGLGQRAGAFRLALAEEFGGLATPQIEVFDALQNSFSRCL